METRLRLKIRKTQKELEDLSEAVNLSYHGSSIPIVLYFILF